MSYYEDERQRMRPARESSRRDYYDDDYEAAYSSRGYENRGYDDRGYEKNNNNNNRTMTVVRRRDSYDDVDEEITREFSPPGGGRGGYYRETTIRKSGVRPARARSFDDDRDFDSRRHGSTYVGAGARRDERNRDDRRDRDHQRRYYSDESSRSRTPPPRRERRKSRVEETLESLGLGGLVGGILGKEAKDRSSSQHRSKSRSGRDRAYSETRSESKRSRSGGEHTKEQVIQAVKAALLAGAGEAIRVRNDTGGEKGKRILTAALSAGGVDGLLNANKDPEHHRKRDTIGSAIAGIATSRIVNGPRSQSRGRASSPDRRRGRSESRGSVGNLLAGGAVAAAAKKVYDNMRSSSRGRSESASRRTDVSDSPPRNKSRRRSASRAAARGLAALGLNKAADKMDPDRERDRSVSRHSRSRRRRSDDYDDSNYSDYREDVGQPRSGDVNGRARSLSQSRSDWQIEQTQPVAPGGYSLDFKARHTGDPDTDSDSDLGSSTDEEKERKKGKRKLFITTGLASVATIHAGHSMYQSYEKHHARKLAVKEGKISPEQAKKNQNRDRMQEVASVGIAALGLKGAYSEWKEMHEHRTEFNEELEKQKRHKEKRHARRKKFERLEKQGYSDSGYASSMPNLHSPPMTVPPGGWHQPFQQQPDYNGQVPYSANVYAPGAPHYYDDNPYGGSYYRPADQTSGSPFPPPPVGNDHNTQARAPRQRSPSRGRPER